MLGHLLVGAATLSIRVPQTPASGLPAGVALQRNLADAIGMPPWELRTNGK